MDNLNLLTRLLQVSGFKSLTCNASFELFQKLEEALVKDGKPTSVEIADMIPRTMSQPIYDTYDLLSYEDELVYCLVASWAQSVTSPLLKELDEIFASTKDDSDECDSEELTIYADMQYMADGGRQMTLCMEGDFNRYQSLVLSDNEALGKVERVINDYKHTLAVIEGANQLSSLAD